MLNPVRLIVRREYFSPENGFRGQPSLIESRMIYATVQEDNGDSQENAQRLSTSGTITIITKSKLSKENTEGSNHYCDYVHILDRKYKVTRSSEAWRSIPHNEYVCELVR